MSFIHQTASRRHTGFTLIEILAALGVIVLLAAILFPVFARVREKSRQTACASNLHQLGMAIFSYIQDYDERHPVVSVINPFNGLPGVNGGVGWAGRIYPYVKTTSVFSCPDDATDSNALTMSVPVSYALNDNLSPAPSQETLTAPASTVLLFEVTDDQVAVTKSDEGRSLGVVSQESAAGDGENGSLINLLNSSGPYPDGALYATGTMYNVSNRVSPTDQYDGSVGRHTIGSNFLAADGHAKWQRASKVSAGENALSPSNPQALVGCAYNGLGRGGAPCAEGTTNGAHGLTFSVI